MKIHGLQKMTLLDFPGKVSCTVFTGGCDFRCPFCHNAELIDGRAPALMEEEELLNFLKGRTKLLDGVAITGGEPLLFGDTEDLIKKIKDLGYPVKLDTNGNHPDRLIRLVENKLVDYVAMDIKNDKEKYAVTAGLENLDMGPICESVAFLLTCPCEYEFRTTTVDELHDQESFEKIGEWIRGAEKYFIQPFVDRDTVVYEGLHAPPREKLNLYLETIRKYVPNAALRGE